MGWLTKACPSTCRAAPGRGHTAPPPAVPIFACGQQEAIYSGVACPMVLPEGVDLGCLLGTSSLPSALASSRMLMLQTHQKRRFRLSPTVPPEFQWFPGYLKAIASWLRAEHSRSNISPACSDVPAPLVSAFRSRSTAIGAEQVGTRQLCRRLSVRRP